MFADEPLCWESLQKTWIVRTSSRVFVIVVRLMENSSAAAWDPMTLAHGRFCPLRASVMFLPSCVGLAHRPRNHYENGPFMVFTL